MNPDLSLQEVRQWKDTVSDILAHLSIQERLEYFRKADERKGKKIGKKETASHADDQSVISMVKS